MLDVTVWRQKDSMTVHLVNLTNPMMMKGPMRELIPTAHTWCASGCPGRRRCSTLLVAGSTADPRRSGDWIEVTIPVVGSRGGGGGSVNSEVVKW